MSNIESTPLPLDPGSEQALAPSSSLRAPRVADREWSGTPIYIPNEPSAGASLVAYLHALRRHWLMAASAGAVLAVALGTLVFLFKMEKYTASATLQVYPTVPQSVFQTAESRTETGLINAFDIYKNTQQLLVKSRDVLVAALRDKNVKGLPSVVREERKRNTLAWLTENVQVIFPTKDSEIMVVSMTGPSPEEVTTLVNAVVQAYFDVVVNVQRAQRRIQLGKLEEIYAEKENQVRKKRNELAEISKALGTSDSEALSLKEQIAMQQYAEYRKELTRMQFELTRARAQLRVQESLLAGIGNMEVSEFEVNALAAMDPLGRQLAERLMWQRMLQSEVEANVVKGSTPLVQHSQRQRDSLQQQLDEQTAQYRERVRNMKRADLEKERQRLKAEVETLTEQEAAFQKDVDKQQKEAEQIGQKSIDVQMMKPEVKRLDQVLSSIAEECEKLRVELNSAPRVEIRQRAEIPETESGRGMRMTLIILASLFGLCLPAVAIALWDARAGRINAVADVSKGLGLVVLGSVPALPARTIRPGGPQTKRSRAWEMRLTEAVDGLAARLLRKADREQTRVILVTSAMAGEGKTTLATHLARSLARNLRQTVLVDFDLRRPNLHRLAAGAPGPDGPTGQGVCEALCGFAEVDALVRPTPYRNLSVVTAGHWDRRVLAALANGAAKGLLEKLRERFEFVIIDSSPVLPVADTRYVSQHVDAVILSVFRDVSQGPRVVAACEILEAFGVRTMEAVVTAAPDQVYGKGTGYEAHGTASPTPPPAAQPAMQVAASDAPTAGAPSPDETGPVIPLD